MSTTMMADIVVSTREIPPLLDNDCLNGGHILAVHLIDIVYDGKDKDYSNASREANISVEQQNANVSASVSSEHSIGRQKPQSCKELSGSSNNTTSNSNSSSETAFSKRVHYNLLLLCVVAIASFQLIELLDMPKHPMNFGGITSEKFAKVQQVFKKNFQNGWEREGAAIAVYHKGELVVDLYGGYADASSLRPWTPETRTVVFSATKAVGALCVAMLVDRGHLAYDDLVTKYWPEYGKHGKENTTVDWIMSHKAGLPAVDAPICREDTYDYEAMAKYFEEQKPYWEPGTKHGYHAMTYGWLVDQLIRRADPKHRGVAGFFREEIAKPYDIDFHIGLPKEEEHTMSRLSMPSTLHVMKEIIYDPRVIFMLAILNLRPPSSVSWKVRKTPEWFKLERNRISFNDPDVHQMEQVAALGISKAKDMGKIFSLMLEGKFIGADLLNQFRTPTVDSGLDQVVMAPMAKGHGFYYERHPTDSSRWLVGHPGFGGSTLMFDMDQQIVISYVTNGLKTGMGELTRTYRLLRNAVFECL